MNWIQDLRERWQTVRKQLSNPGTFEALHRETRMMFPTNHMVEGIKVDFGSLLSQSFIASHSFAWGNSTTPPSYHFTSIYNTSRFGLHGTVDHDGNLQARGNYNWIPQKQTEPHINAAQEEEPVEFSHSSTSKFQAQVGKQGQDMLLLEHEHIGNDFSFDVKAINMNPIDTPPTWSSSAHGLSGIFVLGYLQSVSKNLSLGAELTVQKPNSEYQESSTSYCLRWASTDSLPKPSSYPPDLEVPFPHFNPKAPTTVFTTQFSPANGLLQSTFWRRLNPRLEVGTELQLLMTPQRAGQPGKRNGQAQVGFKLDTVWATIRAMVTSSGTLSCVIEERIVPGVSFSICSEMDYSKGRGGTGKVGFGFTLEA